MFKAINFKFRKQVFVLTRRGVAHLRGPWNLGTVSAGSPTMLTSLLLAQIYHSTAVASTAVTTRLGAHRIRHPMVSSIVEIYRLLHIDLELLSSVTKLMFKEISQISIFLITWTQCALSRTTPPFCHRLVWRSSAEVRHRDSDGRYSHRWPQQQNRRPACLMPTHAVDMRHVRPRRRGCAPVCRSTTGTIDVVQSRHPVSPFVAELPSASARCIPVQSDCSFPVFAWSPSS